ncbi:class I adenylate-forming enzyme family protein [Marinobacter sp. SS21]|uniref:class I adenylate-forming enzyme family protein n=1 Tax=Marinobacter sp. SS21 TaxID=2979460 RepID=UPI0023300054|nr:class I adenylate-forming enzyme family protein [Marinobacter sp. SS21]MDC0662367.1 class I adenylate-forming enzyme family protein [Marinobacter sp. SS21]
MQSNLASLLWQAADQWPEATFLEGEQRHTFQEARSACTAIAITLRHQGVQPGDRVVILASNRSEIVLSLFAVAAIGAVAVILHEQTTPRSLHHILGELEPALVLLGQECSDRAAMLAPAPVLDIDSLPSSAEPSERIEPSAGEDRLAFIIYTSGSTGLPRGVMLSHNNVLFVVPAIQARLGYRCDDRIGLFLPLSFDYGLYQAFLAALTGACLVIRDNQTAGPLVAKTLARDGISVLPGLPNLFASLLRLAQRKPLSLPKLRLISSTGAHFPGSQIDALQAFMPSVAIYPMYGLTECKRVSILTPEERKRYPGSVGRPLDGTQTWVAGDDGQPLPPGQQGELVVAGPHVSAGYWQSPTETEKRFRPVADTPGKALFTGDLFQQDEQGYLYYVGRKDEQIKRHGYRLSRLDIERAALEQDGVSSASAVLADDLLILFASVDDGTWSTARLQERLAQVLEPYKLPDRIVFLEELPQTRNGKIDSNRLKELQHASA